MPAPESRKWMLLAGVAGGGLLLWLLAPVLTPFAIAALLAYIGDPLVDRMEALRLPRTLAVIIVFLALALAALLLLLVLVPLLEREIGALLRNLPAYLDWLQRTLLPRVAALLGPEVKLPGMETLRQAAIEHWQGAGGLLAGVFSHVSRSGLALLAGLGNLVLVPVVTFYLLRDWDRLLELLRALIPRARETRVVAIARDCDRVLAEFLRGQITVMILLGIAYSAGLWLVGLDLAILIGMSAGLVSFVPYLGPMLGVVLAGVAAYLQFQELLPLLWVALVFGAGQALEGMLLTPVLVGDRIGLHPVVVIFAVLAGGQLFGFVGVLLALPAAAVVLVLLRHAHARYVQSELYRS